MAKTKYQGLTVIIGADVTPLNKAMREAKAEATVLRTHLSALNKLLEFNPASTELIIRKQRLLGESISANRLELAKLKAAHENYAARAGSLTKFEEVEWRNVQRRMTNVELEYERLKQEAISYGAAASTSTLKARASLQKLSTSLSTVANKLMNVSITAGIIGGLCVKAAVEYEYAFADVRKTIIATEEEYENLSQAVRNLAKEKPISQDEIAKIMSLGGQLAIATEHLEMFSSVVADLDVATDMELEEASLQLARFANIVGMSQGDFDRLGATIVDLGNNSATTESQIMLMAMRIAGSASNIGMSAANVLALAAALSSVGIQAEMGGNAIATIMNRIDKDVATTSDTLQVWADTAGMSAQEFSTLWQNDVTNALTSVIKGMGEFRDEGNNLNILLEEMGINYMRQIDTMQRLSRSGDLLTSMFERSDTAWENNTALVREATQRYDTAEAKLQIMKNAIREAGITIGEEILPYLKDVVVNVTDVINAFAKMDDGTKTTILTLGAFVIAAGPVVKALQMQTQAVASTIDLYSKFKTTLAFYVAEQTAAAAATTAHAAAVEVKSAAEMAGAAATTANTAAEAANTATTTANTASTAANTVAQEAQTIAANTSTGALVKQAAALKLASLAGSAMLPILALVAGAIGAVSLGMWMNANQTSRSTSITKEHEKAVYDAKTAYDAAKETYGEFSNEALEAKAALDAEQASLEENSQTMAEFLAKCDECIDGFEEWKNGIKETADAQNDQAGNILYLTDALVALSEAEGDSIEKKEKMAAAASSLAEQSEAMAGIYDETTGTLNLSTEALKNLAQEEANRIKGEAAHEKFNECYEKSLEIQNNIVEVEKEIKAAQDSANESIDYSSTLLNNEYIASQEAATSMDELAGRNKSFHDQLNDVNQEMSNQLEIMKETKNRTAALKGAMEEIARTGRDGAEVAAEYSEKFGTLITQEDIDNYREAQEKLQAINDTAASNELLEALEELAQKNASFAHAVSNSNISLEELATRLYESGISAEDFSQGVEDMQTKVSDALTKIEYDTDVTVQSMKETLQNNLEVTAKWSDNMSALWERAGSSSQRNFLYYLQELGPEYGHIVDQLVKNPEQFDELATIWGNAGDQATISFLESLGMLPDDAKAIVGQMNSDVAETAGETGTQTGEQQMQSYAEGITASSDVVVSAADTVSKLVADHLSNAALDAWWAGNNMVADSFRSGIDEGRNAAVVSADTASKHTADHLSSSNGDAWWAGYNMMMGMRDGIDAGRSAVVNAARSAVAAANQAAKEEADINSPSRVWREIGAGMSEGAALGIEDETRLIVQSARDAISATNKAAQEQSKEITFFELLSTIGNSDLVPVSALTTALSAGGAFYSPDAAYGEQNNITNNYNTQIDLETMNNQQFAEELVTVLYRWNVLRRT